MHRVSTKISCLLFLALLLGACSKSVDDIIQANNEAKAGKQKTDINNLIFEGTATSMGFEMPFKLTLIPPDKLVYEINAFGQSIVTVFDGKDAWQIDSIPRAIKDFKSESIKETMDYQLRVFDNELMNYKDKGTAAELIGEDTLDSKQVYKIQLTLKDSSKVIYFIDKVTNLELKSISQTLILGRSISQTIYYSDYKKVGNYMLPHKWTYMMMDEDENEQVTQVLEYSKIEINSKIDDKIFIKPPILIAETEQQK